MVYVLDRVRHNNVLQIQFVECIRVSSLSLPAQATTMLSLRAWQSFLGLPELSLSLSCKTRLQLHKHLDDMLHLIDQDGCPQVSQVPDSCLVLARSMFMRPLPRKRRTDTQLYLV